MKIRSFLAFDIPDDIKSEMAMLVSLLSPKVKGVKWVRPDLMHCTIRFLGDMEEEFLLGRLSDVVEREVRHQSSIRLVGRGVGVFPNWRYPRVIWAGLQGETQSVISLHAKIEHAFAELNIRPDPRVLRLHLTLGRSRAPFKNSQDLVKVVEKMADEEFGEFVVDSLVLYRSVLKPDGPIYTPLKRFPLGGKGAEKIQTSPST